MMRQIAIDGPAGAGKSTIAKEVSKKTHFQYVDTGAMYRTLALCCVQNGIDLADEAAVSELCDKAQIEVRYEDGNQLMILEGEDVSEKIRTSDISAAASAISKYIAVRERLVAMQQKIAEEYDVVMDGRDIGTKVLPAASLKIYLTASVEVRAERRYKEFLEKGMECDLEEVKKDIAQRDHNDMTREHSPLTKADDAIEIDTSYMSIEEVADKVFELLEERE